jgi:hypothetical protein
MEDEASMGRSGGEDEVSWELWRSVLRGDEAGNEQCSGTTAAGRNSGGAVRLPTAFHPNPPRRFAVNSVKIERGKE